MSSEYIFLIELKVLRCKRFFNKIKLAVIFFFQIGDEMEKYLNSLARKFHLNVK